MVSGSTDFSAPQQVAQGVSAAETTFELFSGGGAVGNRTSFGIVAAVTATNQAVKLLSIDTMYVHCPKLR